MSNKIITKPGMPYLS